MKFIREKTKNYFLADTLVSNLFIGEYLPGIPGDSIKVYLYSYMHAEIGNILTNESIAKALGLKIEDVLAAWNCFEDLKMIKKRYKKDANEVDFDVIFVDLRESLYGNGDSPRNKTIASQEKNSLGDESIQKVFEKVEKIIGKPIPGNDFQKIGLMLELPGIDPELVPFAYSYCVNRGKPITASYVRGIVNAWSAAGVKTEQEAIEYLGSVDVRYDFYKKIMNALGLYARNITNAEKKIFDVWLDEYGYTLDEILSFAELATGKDNKFSYVKKIIENNQKGIDRSKNGDEREGKGKDSSLKKYYAAIRRNNEEEFSVLCAEIYKKIPEIVALDKDLKNLNIESISAGFSKATNRDSVIKQLNEQIKEKTLQKKRLLESNGYSLSDFEMHYNCYLCKDTGILENGTTCQCYSKALNT